MTQWLVDLIARLGYAIVGLGVGIESLGVPVPGETALVIGAVTAAQGRLNPVGVGLAAFAGAVIGDNIGYLIGHRWGRQLVAKPGFRLIYDERRMAAADRFFERRGWLAVFLGRFVALLRIFAGPLAGMHHMPWGRFVLANAAGAAIWVSTIMTIGLLIGNNLDTAITVVSRMGYAGLALAVLAAVAYVIWHRRRSRRELEEGAAALAARSGEPPSPKP